VGQSADIDCDKLRLRSNRALYGDPAAAHSETVIPEKHGTKFKLNAPESCWAAEQDLKMDDPQQGTTAHVRL